MLDKLFDTLADMGIWIRFHDKRTEPPTEEGRAWGPTVEGFLLSIAVRNEESISVLIKNTNAQDVGVQMPGWLQYLRPRISGAGGSAVAMRPYGKQLMEATQTVQRVFPAGKHLATEIPLAALYDLKDGGPYHVLVECAVPGNPTATLVSNEITLGAKP